MINFRGLLFTQGIMLAFLTIGMIACELFDLIRATHVLHVMFISAMITGFFSIIMIFSGWKDQSFFTIRHGFALTILSWVFTTLFGSIPLMMMPHGLLFTNAIFETMSAISGAGSTVMAGLDSTQPGIILWRALLQWYGGIGIIVMTLAISPTLRVGGMQVFKAEGAETAEKVMPRARELAVWLLISYTTITVIWGIGYYILGMTVFEAVVHAMTTLATGGFSTSDGSMQHFNSMAIDFWGSFGMILAALPFMHYIVIIREGKFRGLFKDTQVHTFLIILSIVIFMLTMYLWLKNDYPILQALRYAMFNATSLMSGSGFVSDDYQSWGSFPILIMFIIMFIGGCSGSTSGGLKIFRLQIMMNAFMIQLKKMIYPNGIFIHKFNGKSIDDDIVQGVMGYFLIFICTWLFVAVGLTLTGMDFLTACSCSITALSAAGPGMGSITPFDNFAGVSSVAKWLMIFAMIMGRLEVSLILVVLTPTFWRK